jgi:hypothetical protein
MVDYYHSTIIYWNSGIFLMAKIEFYIAKTGGAAPCSIAAFTDHGYFFLIEERKKT